MSEITLDLKNLVMDYLTRINCQIEHSDGLYVVQFPEEFVPIFGSNESRITFDSETAKIYSCEYVIFGSNFLYLVLEQIKKQAPVTTGTLKSKTSKINSENISVHNGDAKIEKIEDKQNTAIRFYYNINFKSVTNTSFLKWIDVDVESKKQLFFAEDIEIDYEKFESNVIFNNEIDSCYNSSLDYLKDSILPELNSFKDSFFSDLRKEIDFLDDSYRSHLNEINDKLTKQRIKISEIDRKIQNSKNYKTRSKYSQDKIKNQEKLNELSLKIQEEKSRLDNDRNNQKSFIQNRYDPKISSSLIGSQIFTYSTKNCIIHVETLFCSADLSAIYDDYDQKLSFTCTSCQSKSHEIHLCSNQHFMCSQCSADCINCKRDFCKNCSSQLQSCYLCSFQNCTVCSSNCISCKRTMCANHSNSCAICLKIFCTAHSLKCSQCEQSFSESCIQNSICNTCSSLSQIEHSDSIVGELIQLDSELSKYKKWEYATNSKFSIFKAKKTLGKRIIVLDKENKKIIINKKDGWI